MERASDETLAQLAIDQTDPAVTDRHGEQPLF
jgi:hypothetical protein